MNLRYDLKLTLQGGDTHCLAKKLPFVEEDYTRFEIAEAITDIDFKPSIWNSRMKSVEPYSAASPMRAKREAKPKRV